MKIIIFVFTILHLALTIAHAKSAKSMNGIPFDQFIGFEEKWKLITVRYRKDNKEIRIIYANKLAEEAMNRGMKVYPEGSVFAKVAYLAQPDPAFESSLAPAQTRRFQFMIKDSKKYKDHKSWGYALFNSEGDVNPEPENQQVNACAACHDMVPERDYVFSWKFNQSPSKNIDLFKMNYKEVSRKEIPQNILKFLPKDSKALLLITGALTKEVFQGTLDEIKPSLAKIAVIEKKPVLFLSTDESRFTLVYPEDISLECDDEGARGLFLVSVNSLLKNKINKTHFCQSY